MSNPEEVHVVTIQHAHLGDAVERAYADALRQWLKEHRKARDPEVAITSDILEICVTVELRARRRSTAFVAVMGRRPWLSATYPFKLEYVPLSALLHRGED